jgi:hypothetical protein
MSAHTKGPWHVGGTFDPNTPNETQNVWSEAASGKQSGECIAQKARPANARLIAAAPAMVELLADLLDEAEEQADVIDGNDRPIPNEAMRRAERIRAVLNPALGKHRDD